MINQTLVIVTGLALAGWRHVLVHDLLGAASAWNRVDKLSPRFCGRRRHLRDVPCCSQAGRS